MADELTACLKSDAATVISILTAPPFNHKLVRTIDGFTNAKLNLNVYTSDGAPSRVGAQTEAGDKVVIHTQSPK